LKGLPRTKALSTALWGALCQKNTFKNTESRKREYTVPEDTKIEKIYPLGQSSRVEYHYNDKVYETSYARMGCFLTSYARYTMLRTLLSYKDSVVRIHTDGCLMLEKLPVKISTKMGEWKMDHYKTAHVISAQKVTFL
jgi:hypothetical protein